jgi:hypothetical protein
MLTVLWVLGTAGVIAAAALVAARTAAGAARNRVEWTRAYWRALGCARSAQASIDSTLSERANDGTAVVAWRRLDRELAPVFESASCTVSAEAAGAKLDVNWATVEMLERFFAATGRPDAHQIAADIAELRERAPIPDVRALRRVFPTADWAAYDSLLSVEPGRVALSAAGQQVLEAIPGFSPEIASSVIARRTSHDPLSGLDEVLTLVSTASARQLEERFQEASAVAVADPDAWILRSTARSGNPPIASTVEWRIVRQANRVVVARSVVR